MGRWDGGTGVAKEPPVFLDSHLYSNCRVHMEEADARRDAPSFPL